MSKLQISDESSDQTDLSQWKIRKILTESDVALDRMFKFSRAESEHILRSLYGELAAMAERGEAVTVRMVDVDTDTWHRLCFRKVRRGSVFGFKLGWVSHFVARRRLGAGDEVGMFVEPGASLFYFRVLSRRARVVDAED